jgi:hypothetical protein
MTPNDATQDGQHAWWRTCPEASHGSAMAVGEKAAWWRDYCATSLHLSIAPGSSLDAVLRDFAEVESAYLELASDNNNRVNYCELLCAHGHWRWLLRLRRWLRSRW